jgi:hypothetical protein
MFVPSRNSRSARGRSYAISRFRRRRRGLQLESLESRCLLAVLNVGAGALYPTIQSAVDAARPGDTVLIGAGEYAESVDLSRMGVVRGGSMGDLTICGEAAAATVLPPTGHAAFLNAAAFSGDLHFSQLTINGASAGSETSGLSFSQLSGDLTVEELIFERLSGDGIRLSQVSGDLRVQANWFDRVGDAATDAALRVSQFRGAAVVTGNDLADVRGTALEVASGAGDVATWRVDDNRIYGDGSLFSTTVTGIQAVLSGNSFTDLVLDSNGFDGLAGSAIVIQAQDQALLQTRWSVNSATNLQGTAAAQLTLRDSASAALLADTNTWNDVYGDGLAIQVEQAAQLRASVQYDAFTSIGDGVGGEPDEALTLVTTTSATGQVDLFLFNNTLSTVAGNGVRITADGTAAVRAVIEENFFDETNTATAGSALLVEHAADTSGAAVDLRVAGNFVARNQGSAYLLRQRGAAAMRLERDSGTAAAYLAAANTGTPITVTGTLDTLALGHLDASLPLTLGDTIWWDNGDGVQNQGEAGAAGIVVRLNGMETGSGASVNRLTQSDATGTYQFPGLAPGQYTLALEMPSAIRLATPNQGTDDAADSDFDPVTGQATVMLVGPDNDRTVDAGLWRTWQNPRNPLDVNDDGMVVPLDVLLLINDINARNARPLAIPPVAPLLPPPYLDVNGDGAIAALDVLIVINYLNSESVSEEGESGTWLQATAHHDEQSPTRKGATGSVSGNPSENLDLAVPAASERDAIFAFFWDNQDDNEIEWFGRHLATSP